MFQIRYPRILFLVGGAQCSDDCDNPEHHPTILCDFLNSNGLATHLIYLTLYVLANGYEYRYINQIAHVVINESV